MQKQISALVALLSLVMTSVRPVQAQDTSMKAVDPTATPQAIDERVDTKHTAKHHTSPHHSAKVEHDATAALVIAADETRDNVSVRNRPLVLEGHVTQDVLAVNSNVTIKRSAEVGGSVVVIGGSVDNQAGDRIHVTQQNEEVLPALAGEASGLIAVTPPHSQAAEVSQSAPVQAVTRGSWAGSQFAILLFGLLGGALLLLVAPRATQQVASLVGLEPARCLAVGGIAAALGTVVSVLNAVIIKSPVGLLYAPLGAMIALAPLIALAFGWLCGMRYVGDIVARKLGQHGSGNLYSRMALGLGVFFLANLLLGALHLPALGLTAELLAAVMGLGAALISGFGKDPDWLGARLRGESGWFSWGSRS